MKFSFGSGYYGVRIEITLVNSAVNLIRARRIAFSARYYIPEKSNKLEHFTLALIDRTNTVLESPVKLNIFAKLS